jgi:hypothetical protein
MPVTIGGCCAAEVFGDRWIGNPRRRHDRQPKIRNRQTPAVRAADDLRMEADLDVTGR